METTGKPYTNQPTNLRQRRRVSQNGNCNIGVVIAAEADEGVASASIREFSHGQTEASMVGVCLSIIDLFKHSWAVSHVLLVVRRLRVESGFTAFGAENEPSPALVKDFKRGALDATFQKTSCNCAQNGCTCLCV